MSDGKDEQRRRPLFVRGVDGSLKPADEADIGDVWAQQNRISLNESIEADKVKLARRAKRRKRSKPADSGHSAASQAATDPTTIEININMPSLGFVKTAWGRLLQLPGALFRGIRHFKRSVGMTVVSILVVMLALLAYNLIFNGDKAGKSTDVSSNAGGGDLVKGAPPFNTILPSDKSIQQLGGWAKVSPAGRDPVYAYADTINTIKINVSEQPLPKSFKGDPAGSITNLANQFSATQQIQVKDGTVFLGNSTGGVQSLVITKKGLLILIRSDSQIPDETWKDYIESMQ